MVDYIANFKYNGKTIVAVAVGLDRYIIYDGEEIYYIPLIELHKSIFL